MATYDRTGRTYSQTRAPDPRIAAAITTALGDAGSVANVGAGTGSYEPASTAAAIEPSAVMAGQRARDAAPCVRAVAEGLPLASGSVDAALAILTVHHWTDLDAGLAELRRVARRRVVVLTWDADVFGEFWLLRDYLPAAAATDREYAVPIGRLLDGLGPGAARVEVVPVPHDCADGFGGAFWRRPEAYLDATVRAGISYLALTDDAGVAGGLAQLRADLDDGTWAARHADLLDLDELDVGYRLVTVEL